MTQKTHHATTRWILALLGGLLLGLVWLIPFPALLFIAWVPWLLLLEQQANTSLSFWRTWLPWWCGMLLWNALSVWWIMFATLGGMLGAVFAMATLMSFIPCITRSVWRVAGKGVALTFLVASWIAYDYFFHNAEIAWPWLTLGNGWAPWPWIVQWYEYTGVLGGTLWILLFNIAIYLLYTQWKNKNRFWCLFVGALVCVLAVGLPLYSIILQKKRTSLTHNAPTLQTLLIQPNIDPYTEKFSGMDAPDQVSRMVTLATEACTPATQLIVTPETALPESIWENTPPQEDIQLALLHDFLCEYPQATWITGATTLRYYPRGKNATPTSRPLNNENNDRYDAQNVALALDSTGIYDQYIKSKLVVGVEMLPYPHLLGFLTKMSIDLGGTVGGLNTQPERSVFTVPRHGTAKLAPIICYESAFGEYLNEYVQRGAQALVVITNDGWWGDTPGYRQHLTFSQLRCIETRRAMARCANTGISAFISPTGTLLSTLPWWEEGTLSASLPLLKGTTFYVQHGDYLGRVATALMVLLMLYYFVQRILKSKKPH